MCYTICRHENLQKGVLVICVLVFTVVCIVCAVFWYCLCIFILIRFLCTSVRTTATEWQLNCSNTTTTNTTTPTTTTTTNNNNNNKPEPISHPWLCKNRTSLAKLSTPGFGQKIRRLRLTDVYDVPDKTR